MFTRHRPTVLRAHGRHALQEATSVGDTLVSVQRVIKTNVDATVTEVTVEQAVNVELIHQSSEITQVCAQVRGRNRGIFEAWPPLLIAFA